MFNGLSSTAFRLLIGTTAFICETPFSSCVETHQLTPCSVVKRHALCVSNAIGSGYSAFIYATSFPHVLKLIGSGSTTLGLGCTAFIWRTSVSTCVDVMTLLGSDSTKFLSYRSCTCTGAHWFLFHRVWSRLHRFPVHRHIDILPSKPERLVD